jgi:integrase
MAHVEDRWYRTVKDADGTKRRERSERHGTGLRWRARYDDPDGRGRNRSFATRVMAEKFITEVEHSKLAGSYRDPDAGRVTLGSYARDWLAARTCDPATRQVYEGHIDHHIAPALGGERLDQLAARPSRVQAFVAGLVMAPSTARQILGTLSRILAAAVDDGLIPRNPCKAASVRAPRQVQRKVVPWTGPQVAAVRAELPEQLRALADAGEGLGLRQGELFGLPVENIDFLRKVVHVRLQVRIVGTRRVFAPPKGGRERDVPLPDVTAVRLAEHIRQHPPADVTLPWRVPGGRPTTARLLFRSGDGNALLRGSFNNIWRPAVRRAGINSGQKTGSHQLRHRYASVLLAGGVDVRALSEYLGHHDPSFTLRVYAHLMPSAEGRARRAIEAAFAEDHVPGTSQDGRSAP